MTKINDDNTNKQQEEKRQQKRFNSDDTVFIELEEQLLEDNSQSHIIICQVLDVSTQGLRVEIDRPVIAGSYLRIGVKLADADIPLLLTGEVKWVRQVDSSCWQAGFALIDSQETDLESWKLLIQ